MEYWNTTRNSGLPVGQRKLAAQCLKRCPLCGTLNARPNPECVTCRWHGAFDDDPVLIEEGLQEMMEHCPDLLEVLLPRPRRRLGPWQGLLWIWSQLKAFFARPVLRRRSRLDYRA